MKTNVLSKEDQEKKLEIQKEFYEKREYHIIITSFIMFSLSIILIPLTLIGVCIAIYCSPMRWILIIILVFANLLFVRIFFYKYLDKFNPEKQKKLELKEKDVTYQYAEIIVQAYDEITERNFWQYLKSKKWLKKIN